MKWLKKFFSKQRSVAMLIGVVLGVVFGLVAFYFANSTFWSSLFLNLASGALEVPLIASLLGFWNEISKEAKAKKAKRLVVGNLDTVNFNLTLALAQVFGFNFKPSDEDIKDYRILLKNYKKNSSKYLDAIDFEHFDLKITEAVAETYFSQLDSAASKLQTCLNEFGFALDEEVKGDILELKQYITSILALKPTIQNMTKQDVLNIRILAIKSSSDWMRTYLSNLRKHLNEG